MRQLPVPDPGTPPTRTATGYLWWLVRAHAPTVVGAILFAVVWSLAQALMPLAIGKAIDLGVMAKDTGALVLWTGALLALGVTQALAGIMRHRQTVQNWLGSAYRTMQLTVRQAARLGATLPKRMATGEVVSIGMSDIAHLGDSVDILARAAGALVGIVAVATIMLSTSWQLGLVVVIGVPLLTLAVTLLIRPLHKRQAAYREEQGALTTRAADIVTGLRVLRGVGGEAAFAARYRSESQQLRGAGVRVAKVDSLLEATQVLLPGIFVALVTWLGARLTVAGDITPGQLVAFYGYAVFLMMPLRTLTEAVNKITRGHVAARRVLGLFRLEPEIDDPATPAATPDPTVSELVDPESGLTVRPGQLTAVAAARPEEAAAIADRLGRYADSDAALDGVPLRQLTRATVRDLILVADNDARLFSGRLRDELDPRDQGDQKIGAALDAASAQDIVDALPDGLDAIVAERGREFSGGQQQRLRLTRALLADPPILVLVEPTSAVDAHTEARIAARLAGARNGRTTVVCTTSPLVLDRADRVAFVDGGRVVAEGTHRELLDRDPRYAATVTRGEDE
ncbi:ABC transporter ATP-binding protein [Luedemannella flava]|uniref:ABC transporter ATP-binding protein n=1 Tax=Luedemannella flava TaxID=349316 RepID=A0ABP4Y176_9ACTN